MTEQELHPTLPSHPRRTVLKGAAVMGAVLPFLAACGSDDEPSTPSAGGSSSSDTDTPTPSSGGNGNGNGGSDADVIATTDEVPQGSGVILDDAGVVLTQPTAGEFKGFSNICKHQGCPLSSVTGKTINCDCHGSQYSIVDGSPVTGPSGQSPDTISALDVKEIAVNGDGISLA